MQRLSSASRVQKDHHAIDMTHPSFQHMERQPYLGSGTSRSKFPSKSIKLVHILPAIVLLCLFVLWYFSYPVNLEIKDGRLTGIHRIDMPRSMNKTQVDLTILAKAASTNVSVSDILMIANSTTSPQPADGT